MIKKKTKIYQNIELPWIEKYRPKKLDDVLLDNYIKIKLDHIINQKLIPNLIITGSPGTGKTSAIKCLVNKVFNNNYEDYILELNASDDRGLNIINNTIIPFCKKKINDKYKIIILDEADSITNKAQNLLSNIINEYNEKNRFIFICNDYSKINESIQSNCMIIRFPNVSKKNIIRKVESICDIENIKYDNEAINTLLLLSYNDIRFTINNLECIYKTYNKLNDDVIYKFIDTPKPVYINKIINNSINGNFKDSIKIVKELYNKGYSPNDILLTFMNYLMNNKINLNEEEKLKIYEIVSMNYIRVNDGIDTLLQLCGCISNIYLYLDKN